MAVASLAVWPFFTTKRSPGASFLAKPESSLNVILITIDTLRADHLACYGYKPIETPNIDALARGGARFTQAYTPVPITLPAHAALLTGSFPMATGMHDFSGNKLPSNAVTLARLLSDHGYSTAAFLGSAVLDSRFGLNQGFATYFDHFNFRGLEEASLDRVERPGDQVMDAALDWLRLHPRPPYLLWVHLYDPHYPYTPPAPYAERYRGHLYDGEIAFADAQVGRLVRFLKDQGVFENSILVLAGDHGEGLGEHGEKTHGFFVYNSTLHVPLIVKVPGAAPRIVEDEVSLVDVMPTVLQASNISPPPSVQGRSLLSKALGRSGPAASSELYAETYLPLIHFRWSPLRSLQSGSWKYIDAPRPELYDLRHDPRETQNLLNARQALGHEMHDRLFALARRFTAAAAGGSEKEFTDPALLERLRALGYVAVSAGTFAEPSGTALPDPKDRIQIYDLFSEAMSDGQHGRFEESLRKLREAEKVEPASLPIRYLMALDYYRLKDYRRAADAFQTAIQLDPKFALAFYYLGLTETQLNDLDGAATSFERALQLDSTNFTAAYDLGALYLKKNRVEDALGQFRRAADVNPDYPLAFEAMGEVYLFQGRPAEAAHALERAVEIDPRFEKAHYHLGRAYEALGRPADAKRQFALAPSSR